MEKEAPADHGLSPSSPVVAKPRSLRYAKCAHHPQWTAQEKKQLCCWACQALLDPSLLRRKKPCANPWPWDRDSLGLGLATFKGYKLNRNVNQSKCKKVKNDEAEASPPPSLAAHQEGPLTPGPSTSHVGLAAQNAAALLGAKEGNATPDDLDMLPHDDHPLVGQQDHVADKVAHYLQSITAANGGHGGVSVDTIDDLLARVKSAYMRLIESTPDDICTVTASTDEPDLLVPTVPDCPEEDGNAAEELIATHLATAIPGPEDGVLPPPDPRCSSPDPTPRDRSDSRVDDDREDAASAEGAGRERWMEWAEMDIGELLGDLEDEEDHTDQHWKRSANDQPTATSAGHQDNHNKQYQATEPRRPGTTLSSRLQGEEIQSGEEFHPDSPSYEPPQPERQSFTFGPQQPSYQRGGPPGRPAIPAGHAREDRPTERRSWARGPENQRNDVRQGWGRSSDKRSHDNRPYRPRDTHCRAEAKRHHSHQHSHQHTHYEPRRNWHQSRSSTTRDYSQEHEHNKHMGTTSDAARGRKRSRERTDHFTRSSHARPAHHHHQGSGRDKRRRREDESEQGSSARAESEPHGHTPGEPCDVPEAGHLQDEEKRRAEDDDRTRLDQEQQEWARIRAMTDKHLSNGEQPSPASNMEKRTTDERLNLAWHRLPTPFVFELAEVPYTVLASASGAEMSTLVEKNLKRKRVHLQRAIERQGNDGSSTAVESSCGSQVDQLQVINALLDWCRAELFPFLAEVDLMAHAADAMGRASYLYQHLLLPLYSRIARSQ